MGSCQPIDLGYYHNKNDQYYIYNDIPFICTQDSEKQRICNGNHKNKKHNYSGKTGYFIDRGHEHIGKPFVGRPGHRREEQGEGVNFWDGSRFQHVLPRPYMKPGIAIIQQLVPDVQ